MGPPQAVMREMSTELEQRLQSSREKRIPVSAGRKQLAPRVPQSSGGIKFNERAEVVELEKDKR